jgi:hypothetical protein
LKPDRTIFDVILAREGFLKHYSFIRDRAGNMYWAERGARTIIKKRSPGGRITMHSTGDFREISWMTAAPDGHLFFIDQGDLRRITPDGKVKTVAMKLSEHKPSPAKASNRYYQMGQWLDAEGNVYVAVAGEQLVLKVSADGSSTVIARSSRGWSPSGGLVGHDGKLWLLEYSTTNEVRVRRINRDGSEQVF